jgi:glucosamine kinase
LVLSSPDAAWTPPLAFAGSILAMVAPLRQALIASVQSGFPAVCLREGVVDPVAGALWRARAGR